MKSLINDVGRIREGLNHIRWILLENLQELQADFEDLSDQDLLDCRKVMLERVNVCLDAIEESEEDNLEV